MLWKILWGNFFSQSSTRTGMVYRKLCRILLAEPVAEKTSGELHHSNQPQIYLHVQLQLRKTDWIWFRIFVRMHFFGLWVHFSGTCSWNSPTKLDILLWQDISFTIPMKWKDELVVIPYFLNMHFSATAFFHTFWQYKLRSVRNVSSSSVCMEGSSMVFAA